MPNSPDAAYSGYCQSADNKEKCCMNCMYYVPVDDMKGLCYEYEVLPYAGCNFFVVKEEK